MDLRKPGRIWPQRCGDSLEQSLKAKAAPAALWRQRRGWISPKDTCSCSAQPEGRWINLPEAEVQRLLREEGGPLTSHPSHWGKPAWAVGAGLPGLGQARRPRKR